MFFYTRYLRSISLLFILSSPWHAVNAQSALGLQEAEQLALELDPASKRHLSLAQAMEERAVAVGQLPDPKLKLNVMNLPVDTFKRDQQPMTQMQVGIQQMFPRGDSLKIKTKQTGYMARAEEHRAQDRQRMIRKQVRLKWLEFYYWIRAEEIVRKNTGLFEQLVEVAQLHYGAGRRNQQDVIRAQLELSRLEDRLLEIKTRQEKVRAELGVLVGRDAESIILPTDLPRITGSTNFQEIESALSEHPKILVAKAQINQGRQGVALAREAYKPGWGMGVTYGFRDGQNANGSERPDFLSVGVTVDLPLFRGKRQDRSLRASQHMLGANMQMLDLRYLELKNLLGRNHADWKRLNERVSLYQSSLIPQAKQNTAAALFAYQNARADFPTVMKAHITELNTRLKSILIQVDRAKAKSRLAYLSGEGE